VRERAPSTLDDALRIAQQLEAWTKDAQRNKQEDSIRPRPKVRGAVGDDCHFDSNIEARMNKLEADMMKRFDELVKTTAAALALQRAPPSEHVDTSSPQHRGGSSVVAGEPKKQSPPPRATWPRRPEGRRRPYGVCWKCNLPGHIQRDCTQSLSPSASENKTDVAGRGSKILDKAHVYVHMHLLGKKIPCLLDSGCELTLVPRSALDGLDSVEIIPTEQRVWAANNTDIAIDGKATLPFLLNGRHVPINALISADMEEVMLGADWLQTHKCVWDFARGRLYVNGRWVVPLSRKGPLLCRRVFVQEDVVLSPKQQTDVVARSTLVSPKRVTPNCIIDSHKLQPGLYVGRTLLPEALHDLKVRMINTRNEPYLLIKDTCLGKLSPVQVVENNVDTVSPPPDNAGEQFRQESTENADNTTDNVRASLMSKLPDDLFSGERCQVEQLLTDYDGLFSRSTYDMGHTTLIEHTIDTGSHRPIRQALRRHPMAQLDVIDQQVDQLERNDLIEKAASPWSSNVVMVRKKDGSYRLCVDYRAVNSVTYKDSYPLPHIDTCLGSMDGAQFFSTLDLRAGYHCIPIKVEDRDKTAFITRRGCFRYKVMPFGLTSAPSVFQRLMDLVLCGLTYESVLVYLDDIIVYSKDFSTHVHHLRDVFQRLRKAGLKLHPSKCCLFQRRVAFLGHVISSQGIEVQADKVSTVRDWPSPRNLSELRAFVGLCSYYRRFIPQFADIAAPLHDLQRKDIPFVWTLLHEEAFMRLKEALTTAPVLGMPRENGTLILDSDSSDVALGCVLSQLQDGAEVVLAYASRALSRAERNYDVTKKELLAVVYGLKTFKQYVLGRRFVVRTDHAALQWLRRTPEPMGQQARWLTFIEMFDFEIRHRAGRRHGNADGLSRKPLSAHGVAMNSDSLIDLEASDSGEMDTDITVCKSTLSADSPPFVPRSFVENGSNDEIGCIGESCLSSCSSNAKDDAKAVTNAEIRVVQTAKEDAETLTEEVVPDPIANLQLCDSDIGPVLRLRLQQEAQPSIEAILLESAAAKRLWSQWHRLSLINGVLYRTDKRIGDDQVKQLLIPVACKKTFCRRCTRECVEVT